jgi:hypothetical protein
MTAAGILQATTVNPNLPGWTMPVNVIWRVP